jgi:hypothetical protein
MSGASEPAGSHCPADHLYIALAERLIVVLGREGLVRQPDRHTPYFAVCAGFDFHLVALVSEEHDVHAFAELDLDLVAARRPVVLPDTLIEYVGVMVVGDGGGQRPNDQRVGCG